MRLCSKYQKLPSAERQKLQQQRLRQLVDYAKSNSPYFSGLYADVSEDYSLSYLPATNKRDLMEHWNACECKQQHFHINDDWVIVEPVDTEGNPVPDGQLADKYLLTNLYNYTQPMIRYEVTDRIIYHSEPCSCGNPSPWIEVEGRNDDVLIFEKLTLQPLSTGFFLLYTFTGLTDVLDGWIARKTKKASNFGARLDSIADLLFYIVMLLSVFFFYGIHFPAISGSPSVASWLYAWQHT